MKFEYYLQRFKTDFPVLDSNISIHLLNYYFGTGVGKQNYITLCLNDKKVSGFWNTIIKLNIDEAKKLHKALGDTINDYNKERQSFREIESSTNE